MHKTRKGCRLHSNFQLQMEIFHKQLKFAHFLVPRVVLYIFFCFDWCDYFSDHRKWGSFLWKSCFTISSWIKCADSIQEKHALHYFIISFLLLSLSTEFKNCYIVSSPHFGKAQWGWILLLCCLLLHPPNKGVAVLQNHSWGTTSCFFLWMSWITKNIENFCLFVFLI